MRYTSAFSAALLVGGTAWAGTFPYSQSSCTIYYSTVPVSEVRTFHHTTKTTITPTIIVTSARSKTTTPKPTTTTTTVVDTETETSTVQSTDTFTDTTTDVKTITVTQPSVTVTETSTQTTTTTSTSTVKVVPSTAGFTPVRSSLPNADYDGAYGGPPPPSRRSIAEDSFVAEAQEIEERAAGQHVLHHHKYPQSVECTKIRTKSAPAVTSTRTRGKISTVTAPTPTYTTTSETTMTVTSTTVLTAQTTTTSTAESSLSTTIDPLTTTTTSTTTLTETQVAMTTAYEQCMYDNFADELNGRYGMYLLAASQYYDVLNIAGANNALDCCNSCAADSNCAVSVFTSASGGCYNLENCGLEFPARQEDGYDWVVSNGCGSAVS